MTADAGLLLVPLIAVVAALLARRLSPVLRVPIVVFELVLGIIAGPSILGWIQPGPFFDGLAEFGLAMLFFVAGTELDLPAIGRRPVARASIGWIASLALGLAVGFAVAPGEGAVIVAIALSSTALGAILPILRDAGLLHAPFGRSATAIGAVGEFGPLLAISVFLGGRSPGLATVVLLLFFVVAALAIAAAFRGPHGGLHRFVNASLHTSVQYAIRIIMLILAALVVLSMVLDLDMLLGAFTAGIVWRLLMRRAPAEDQRAVESKLEAVAFGLLIPVFFIITGVTFDLDGLVSEPRNLLLLPVFLLALLVIRGVPSLTAAPVGSSTRDRVALGFFAATALPVIVAVTAIGVDEKILDSGVASALVGAGMLSVLVYPVVGMLVHGRSRPTMES